MFYGLNGTSIVELVVLMSGVLLDTHLSSLSFLSFFSFFFPLGALVETTRAFPIVNKCLASELHPLVIFLQNHDGSLTCLAIFSA